LTSREVCVRPEDHHTKGKIKKENHTSIHLFMKTPIIIVFWGKTPTIILLGALVAEARPYYAPIKAFDLWIVVIAARKQFSFSAHPNSGRLICIAVINISSYDHIHVDRDPCIWRNLLLIPLQVDFPPKKPQWLIELITRKTAIYSEGTEEKKSLASSFLLALKESRLESILDRNILGVRMELLKEVAQIAKSCLSMKGEERPLMSEVAERLRFIRRTWREQLTEHASEETECLLENSSNYDPSSTGRHGSLMGLDLEIGRW